MFGRTNTIVWSLKIKFKKINIIVGKKIKWTGMGEFNSDDHYIYSYGQESKGRNGIALILNKRMKNAVLGVTSKMTEWPRFVPKANHSTSQ